MERREVGLALAVVLLFRGASVLLAQQASPGSEAPVTSLRDAIAKALEAGSDFRAAQLTYEQARLQYEQTRAASGLSLGANAALSHADTFDLAAEAGSDESAAGTNTGQAGLSLSLPSTKVDLSATHLLQEPAPQNAGGDLRNTTGGSLSVSQTVWDGVLGGRTRLSLEQARLTLQTKALALESSRKDIEFRVAQAYLSMLSAQRTAELRQGSLEQRTAELDRTRILVDSGKAAEIDRRQAEINLKSAQIDLRSALANLASAQAKLALLMGLDRDARFSIQDVEDPTVPAMDQEAAVKTALENRKLPPATGNEVRAPSSGSSEITSPSSSPVTMPSSPNASGSSALSGSRRPWSGSSPVATIAGASPVSDARTHAVGRSTSAPWAGSRRQPARGPFSCSIFHLCPSCSQKRTLLLGEYMNERLLLQLPHRLFVFTPWSGHGTDLPKVLRVFFRHDKRLHGQISRLIYALVRDFAAEAAGRPLRTAAVMVFQT